MWSEAYYVLMTGVFTDRSEFVNTAKSGIVLEMSIILREKVAFQDTKDKRVANKATTAQSDERRGYETEVSTTTIMITSTSFVVSTSSTLTVSLCGYCMRSDGNFRSHTYPVTNSEYHDLSIGEPAFSPKPAQKKFRSDFGLTSVDCVWTILTSKKNVVLVKEII
jgi:hypothetical protein